ncbi:MAG: hypothetical protein SV375_23870 [Thermodesulfobacteriota bacterium]|nr:hypothetical protein [Thermodesulfobacteriota bacterium]
MITETPFLTKRGGVLWFLEWVGAGWKNGVSRSQVQIKNGFGARWLSEIITFGKV